MYPIMILIVAMALYPLFVILRARSERGATAAEVEDELEEAERLQDQLPPQDRDGR